MKFTPTFLPSGFRFAAGVVLALALSMAAGSAAAKPKTPAVAPDDPRIQEAQQRLDDAARAVDDLQKCVRDFEALKTEADTLSEECATEAGQLQANSRGLTDWTNIHSRLLGRKAELQAGRETLQGTRKKASDAFEKEKEAFNTLATDSELMVILDDRNIEMVRVGKRKIGLMQKSVEEDDGIGKAIASADEKLAVIQTLISTLKREKELEEARKIPGGEGVVVQPVTRFATFINEDGTEFDKTEIQGSITRPKMDPSKPFCAFRGWRLKDGGDAIVDFTAFQREEGRDYAFVASFAPETPATVSFTDGFGKPFPAGAEPRRVYRSGVTPDGIGIDVCLRDPGVPPVPWGKAFAGWVLPGGLPENFGFGSSLADLADLDVSLSVRSSITNVAFPVLYLDGDREVARASQFARDKLAPPPVPDKAHYDSLGWGTEGSGDAVEGLAGRSVGDFLREPATKLVFHAVRRPHAYTVSFRSRTADSAEPSPYGEPATGTVEAPVSDPGHADLPGRGFRFWSSDGSSSYVFSDPVKADLVLTALYEPVEYAATFLSDGSKFATAAFTVDGRIVPPAASPEYDDRVFVRWDDASGNPFDFRAAPAPGDISLHAFATQKVYKVTFHAGKGASRLPKGVGPVIVGHGSPVAEPAEHPDPANRSSEWLGWYAKGEGDPYDFSSPVLGNMVIEGRWNVPHSSPPAPGPVAGAVSGGVAFARRAGLGERGAWIAAGVLFAVAILLFSLPGRRR